MAASLPIRRKIIVGVALIVLVQILSGYWAIHGAAEFIRIAAERRLVNAILRTEFQLLIRLDDCETGQRGFLLTGEEPYLRPYSDSVKKVPTALAEFRAACGDRYAPEMERLQTLIDKKLGELDATIALRRQPGDGFERALDVMRNDQGQEAMNEIRRILGVIDTAERQHARDLAENLDALSSPTMIRVFLLGLLSIAIAVVAGWFFYRDADKRLNAERMLNEQRSILETVLNGMSDSVVVADAQGRFKLFNAAASKLHGRTTSDAPPQDWARSFGFYRLDKRTPYPSEELPLARALRGEVTLGAELYLKRPDTEGVFLGISARPIYDEQGRIWGGLAVSRDIGVQKEAEAILSASKDELERRVVERTADLETANTELLQRSRENEMFVYSVSHDLRTPLVSLQGFSNEMTLAGAKLQRLFEEPAMPRDLAERGITVLVDDVATSVRFIQTAVLRLSNIIDSLLRLSRAGRVEYQWSNVDLNAIVRRILEVNDPEIVRRNVAVQVDRMPTVWGDPTAVEQLFANLIDNSIKYLAADRPGRIHIGVANPPTDDEGRCVLFFEDNGVGIPDQGRQKIFRAFERMHPGHAPGEGIGLAVVERIVERHRGCVWVESAPGKGSRFYIAIPASEDGAARSTGGDKVLDRSTSKGTV